MRFAGAFSRNSCPHRPPPDCDASLSPGRLARSSSPFACAVSSLVVSFRVVVPSFAASRPILSQPVVPSNLIWPSRLTASASHRRSSPPPSVTSSHVTPSPVFCLSTSLVRPSVFRARLPLTTAAPPSLLLHFIFPLLAASFRCRLSFIPPLSYPPTAASLPRFLACNRPTVRPCSCRRTAARTQNRRAHDGPK